jgi:integrase
VNLDDAHIDVRQTLSKKGEVQQRAKSKKSIRRIPIDPETVRRLRAWRAVQAEYFVATIGRMPSSDSPVCSNEVCGFLRQDNFGRWFQGFCVATGFGRWVDDDGDEIPARHLNAQGHPVDESGRPYSRMNPKPRVNRHYKGLTLHGLRHTYATMLVGNGVDFRTASELLGHTSASITLNLYAHALPAQKRAASDLIGSLLSAEQQSNVIAI